MMQFAFSIGRSPLEGSPRLHQGRAAPGRSQADGGGRHEERLEPTAAQMILAVSAASPTEPAMKPALVLQIGRLVCEALLPDERRGDDGSAGDERRASYPQETYGAGPAPCSRRAPRPGASPARTPPARAAPAAPCARRRSQLVHRLDLRSVAAAMRLFRASASLRSRLSWCAHLAHRPHQEIVRASAPADLRQAAGVAATTSSCFCLSKPISAPISLSPITSKRPSWPGPSSGSR